MESWRARRMGADRRRAAGEDGPRLGRAGEGARQVQRRAQGPRQDHRRRRGAAGAERRAQEPAEPVPGLGGQRRPHRPAHADDQGGALVSKSRARAWIEAG